MFEWLSQVIQISYSFLQKKSKEIIEKYKNQNKTVPITEEVSHPILKVMSKQWINVRQMKIKQVLFVLNGINNSKMTLLQIKIMEQSIKLLMCINRHCMLRLNYLALFFLPHERMKDCLMSATKKDLQERGHSSVRFG